MSRRGLVYLIIFLISVGLLFVYFKRISAPEQGEIPEAVFEPTPFPTWVPKPGVEKPTIIYEEIPSSPKDLTKKVEIFGCVIDSSTWGMSYPKKIVEIPNVSAIASETMKAFLKESAESGWGGFPSKAEVQRFFNEPGEVTLKKLTIDKFGTARVYLSQEVKAYGGGSGRVACIHDSVELTLKQFSSIKDVVLCIEDVCADQKGSTVFQP